MAPREPGKYDVVPPSDPRDAARNPYLARELLRCIPVNPTDVLKQIRADGFSSEMGTLLSQGAGFYDIESALRQPDTVALMVPHAFADAYGEVMEGTRSSAMLGIALQDHLEVPRRQFTVGGAYDGHTLAQHLVLINRRAWQAMARKALLRLADSTEGAELLGLKNPTLYHNALANPDSMASQTIVNLLSHADLSERDMARMEHAAITSENYEFATQLTHHRERRSTAQGRQ